MWLIGGLLFVFVFGLLRCAFCRLYVLLGFACWVGLGVDFWFVVWCSIVVAVCATVCHVLGCCLGCICIDSAIVL